VNFSARAARRVAAGLVIVAGWFAGAAAGAAMDSAFGAPAALALGALGALGAFGLVSLLTAHAHARGARRIAHSRR
jgi:hypothetical protein